MNLTPIDIVSSRADFPQLAQYRTNQIIRRLDQRLSTSTGNGSTIAATRELAREQLDAAEALLRDLGRDWWQGQAEELRVCIDRGGPCAGRRRAGLSGSSAFRRIGS